MEDLVEFQNFWKDKKVFLTGHTGFKGAWLSKILSNLGALVTGYSLEPPTNPNLFEMLQFRTEITSIIGDVRDFDKLKRSFDETSPDIVIHMAAQPLVRDSYENPVHTYDVNVMGTVNLLECVRSTDTVQSCLNVTTDKVYFNNEWPWGYRETDPLDGYDPYSNSKSCSELVTHSYKRAFFLYHGCAVSTARAGNVIGGGDFSKDRIIPDAIRSVQKGEKIVLRNPSSVRPYQHVIEPLFAYLLIAKKQYENSSLSDYYNVGPDSSDCVTTEKLIRIFCENWGESVDWINSPDNGPHEAGLLKLDCSLIKNKLGWFPKLNINEALKLTCEWNKSWLSGAEDINIVMDRQIAEYMRCF